LRLETIYVCRFRGRRNASVAASRPAPYCVLLLEVYSTARSRGLAIAHFFYCFPLRLTRINGSEKGQSAEVKKTARPL